MENHLALVILSAQTVFLSCLWVLKGFIEEADEALHALHRQQEHYIQLDYVYEKRPPSGLPRVAAPKQHPQSAEAKTVRRLVDVLSKPQRLEGKQKKNDSQHKAL